MSNIICDETGTCCDPTLLGCDGLCDSGSVIDVCGICGGAGDSCDGCDGVPASGLVLDSCGVCDGDDTSCLDCRSKLLRARWFAADDVDTVVGEVLIMPIPVDDYDIVDWYDYGAGVANSKSFGVVAGAKNPTLVDALRIVAVRDNSGSSFLVVTLDAVSGATGGSASLEIASNMGGFPVGVVVRDDPVDDIFIFNSADVSGLFDFEWPAHETDGFVLGPCPTETALCVNLTLTTSQNINGLSIGSWNTVDELLEDAVPHHSLIDAGATIEVCTHCSADLDCAGIGGGDHFYDLCDVCRSPTDSLDIIDSTCFDCNGELLGLWTYDLCGDCLAPDIEGETPKRDLVCRGCAGVINATACVDCTGAINGAALLDRCDVCNGDGSTCFKVDDRFVLIIGVAFALVGTCFVMGLIFVRRARTFRTNRLAGARLQRRQPQRSTTGAHRRLIPFSMPEATHVRDLRNRGRRFG